MDNDVELSSKLGGADFFTGRLVCAGHGVREWTLVFDNRCSSLSQSL
jgi:hypothetical protein